MIFQPIARPGLAFFDEVSARARMTARREERVNARPAGSSPADRAWGLAILMQGLLARE
jgi:hypothetical protein